MLVTGVVLRREGGVEEDDPPRMGGYWGGDGDVSGSIIPLPSCKITGGFEAMEDDRDADPDEGGPAFGIGLDMFKVEQYYCRSSIICLLGLILIRIN